MKLHLKNLKKNTYQNIIYTIKQDRVNNYFIETTLSHLVFWTTTLVSERFYLT